MKHVFLTLLTSLALAFGLVGCKSGGASDGPSSAPASAPAAAADAHHEHGDDHHDDGDGHHDHGDGHHDHGDAKASAAPVAFDTAPAVGAQAKCPVSGETFTVDEDTDRAEHAGKHYAFCCSKCSDKFEADPSKFVGK